MDRSDFNSVVAEKVETLKEYIRELEKEPGVEKMTIPFYVPIRQDRLFPDFKKTVAAELLKEGYEMSDFLHDVEVLAYGVTRFVQVTKVHQQ